MQSSYFRIQLTIPQILDILGVFRYNGHLRGVMNISRSHFISCFTNQNIPAFVFTPAYVSTPAHVSTPAYGFDTLLCAVRQLIDTHLCSAGDVAVPAPLVALLRNEHLSLSPHQWLYKTQVGVAPHRFRRTRPSKGS